MTAGDDRTTQEIWNQELDECMDGAFKVIETLGSLYRHASNEFKLVTGCGTTLNAVLADLHTIGVLNSRLDAAGLLRFGRLHNEVKAAMPAQNSQKKWLATETGDLIRATVPVAESLLQTGKRLSLPVNRSLKLLLERLPKEPPGLAGLIGRDEKAIELATTLAAAIKKIGNALELADGTSPGDVRALLNGFHRDLKNCLEIGIPHFQSVRNRTSAQSKTFIETVEALASDADALKNKTAG
jgi:hypothetical protein